MSFVEYESFGDHPVNSCREHQPDKEACEGSGGATADMLNSS
jgi:hypothetical protein